MPQSEPNLENLVGVQLVSCRVLRFSFTCSSTEAELSALSDTGLFFASTFVVTLHSPETVCTKRNLYKTEGQAGI